MTTDTAYRIAQVAAKLRRTHPQAPAVDLLDLLLGAVEAGQVFSFPAALLHPRSPLGQLIAEAFDRGMTPQECRDWTGPEADPALSAALLPIWRADVLPLFTSRYGSKEAAF